MTEDKKHFIQLFTSDGKQFNITTKMSFSELDAELNLENTWINLLGIDPMGERITIKLMRSMLVGYMYGNLPESNLVAPVQFQPKILQ